MLTDKEWEEVEKLVDGEYMTQVDDAGFEAALKGVELALAIAQGRPEIVVTELVKRYLLKFGNWQDLDLPKEMKRDLYIRNYGLEEVEAMEESGELEW